MMKVEVKPLLRQQYDDGAYIIIHAAGQTGNGVIKGPDRRNNGDERWVIGVGP